ncbi:MAG TPA: SRPBCC domain-containing protein [Solirubrobacteraceae bacterium]|nr:SRPBCC domain-containing protein [Solirubrobacteraceae bacterium]
MARNEIVIEAGPHEVFEVLADPWAYSSWVTGTAEIRGADSDWPRPGAALHHSVGAGPLRLRDDARVLEAEPPAMLRLLARARPLPSATVTLHLQGEGDATRVVMIEHPTSRIASLLLGPLGHAMLAVRNHESLRRLKALAESRAGSRRRAGAKRGAGA